VKLPVDPFHLGLVRSRPIKGNASLKHAGIRGQLIWFLVGIHQKFANDAHFLGLARLQGLPFPSISEAPAGYRAVGWERGECGERMGANSRGEYF